MDYDAHNFGRIQQKIKDFWRATRSFEKTGSTRNLPEAVVSINRVGAIATLLTIIEQFNQEYQRNNPTEFILQIWMGKLLYMSLI